MVAILQKSGGITMKAESLPKGIQKVIDKHFEKVDACIKEEKKNSEPTRDDLKFVDLITIPEESKKLLFDALNIDITKAKCKYCGEKLTKDSISIMPEIDKGDIRVLTCNSPLCLSQYFEDFEKSKKPSTDDVMKRRFKRIEDLQAFNAEKVKKDAAFAELKKQLHFIKNCAENLRKYRRDLKGHLPKSKVDNPQHVKGLLQDIGFTANCLDKNANKAEQVAQNLFRETWKDGYFEGTVDTSNELNDEIDRLKKAPEIWKDIQEAIKDFKVGGKDGISLLAGSDISKFALRLVEIQKKSEGKEYNYYWKKHLPK